MIQRRCLRGRSVAEERPWTAFARGEITENRELLEFGDGEHGPAFTVGKVSARGGTRFQGCRAPSLGVGGLVAVNFVPDGLRDEYGGRNPLGAMGFLRLKVESPIARRSDWACKGGRRQCMDAAMAGPLKGIRIVEMGGIGPAPFRRHDACRPWCGGHSGSNVRA